MDKIETVIIPTKRVFFNEESGFSVYGVTVKPEDASKINMEIFLFPVTIFQNYRME